MLERFGDFAAVNHMLNPLSYGVDGLRDALSGGSEFGITTDLVVLVVVATILLVIDAYLFPKIEV